MCSSRAIFLVTPDGGVSFMYRYPNVIPLPACAVQGIAGALKPFAYDRPYGAFWGRVIPSRVQAIAVESIERYCNALA